jgi:hypothetical protein
MGLLETMPAYYVLKWVSPASINAGGFGNDRSTPLAMLKQGYGALIQSLADEADLDLRLNAEVVSVERPGLTQQTQQTQKQKQQQLPAAPVRLHFADESTQECDILVLSGPITNFVRGSDSGKVAPILDPPTPEEARLFSPKHAMQFYIQVRTTSSFSLSVCPQLFALNCLPSTVCPQLFALN